MSGLKQTAVSAGGFLPIVHSMSNRMARSRSTLSSNRFVLVKR
jgi:hypothetical protein